MVPIDENPVAAPDDTSIEKVTRHYKTPGVPSSGKESARLLLGRYGPKRDAINRFVHHLKETNGKARYSETQLLVDAGLSASEIEALVEAYAGGELAEV